MMAEYMQDVIKETFICFSLPLSVYGVFYHRERSRQTVTERSSNP